MSDILKATGRQEASELGWSPAQRSFICLVALFSPFSLIRRRAFNSEALETSSLPASPVSLVPLHSALSHWALVTLVFLLFIITLPRSYFMTLQLLFLPPEILFLEIRTLPTPSHRAGLNSNVNSSKISPQPPARAAAHHHHPKHTHTHRRSTTYSPRKR